MRDRARRLAGPLLLSLLLVAPAASAAAADGLQGTVGTPDPDAPAVDEIEVPTEPVDAGVVAAPLTFDVGPGNAMTLADGRRFLDRLELRSPGDDQVLINDLTLEDYVAGVAEMPGRWHLEALKAQAVAARTYAWHVSEIGTYAGRGYDICDTVDCQAFAGASQQEDDDGPRWRQAVDDTTGEVLLDDDGAPILARYFSTSGGRTLPNEVVFPRSGPRPYLVGIDDPADAASPYHRWEVTFTRDEFDAILSEGQTLSSAVPVAEVERLADVDQPGADFRVTGTDGTEVVVDSVDLRTFVSTVAPQRYPDRFPTARADGLRPLPSTLPSSRFTVDVGDREVVVSGRGWGHAVGMGQYGARGRAEDGDDHRAILAAYYNGLEPTTSDDVPERIRVGLSRPTVGSVTPDAPMSIVADGDTVVEVAAGTWQVAGADGGVRLTAPPGWGQPASISRTEQGVGVPSLSGTVAVEAVTATPGIVALQVLDTDDQVVLAQPLRAADAGRQIGVWDLLDGDGDPVPPGSYLVALTVTVADGSTAGSPVRVEVQEVSGPLAVLTGDGDGRGLLLVPVVALAVLALLAVGGAVAGRRRARARRSASRASPAPPRPDDSPGRPPHPSSHEPARTSGASAASEPYEPRRSP